MPKSVACFVSPHGYGHAARACAVLSAIHRCQPDVHFEIFTRVPAWFFAESLAAPFSYHELLTDIGLVQTNSLQEDVTATIGRLTEFLPFRPELLQKLAGQLGPECRLVLCDIAPLGIATATEAGVPSILIENFTWDWIYAGYPALAGRIQARIDYLRGLFQSATHHIQTEPVCAPQPAARTVPPVSRAIRVQADDVRRRLGIAAGQKMVVLTMGGNRWDFAALDRLARFDNIVFVIAGGNDAPPHPPANLRLLPANSGDFFHPDLINAADAVIGKVGYSTLAEVYQAGTPFGYVPRPQFPESPALTAYIEANLPALEFTPAELAGSGWLNKVPQLLALPKIERPTANGAEQIARFVCALLG